jgi:hypothetical protein
MKLKELLLSDDQSISYKILRDGISEFIPPKTLFEIPGLFEKIKKCDEFSRLDDLFLTELPHAEINGIEYKSLTYLIREGVQFIGRFHLYSITATPMMFSMNHLISDDFSPKITPVFYDPIDFKARRGLYLSWDAESPAIAMDEEVIKGLRDKFHYDIDMALSNPKKYLVEGECGIMVRGFLFGEQSHFITSE